MLKKGERGDGMDKLAVLRQYFGFPAFRAGQQTLIDAVLSGRDALGVMPTGGGKSLCYELPPAAAGNDARRLAADLSHEGSGHGAAERGHPRPGASTAP